MLVSGVLSAWTLVLADTWVRSGIPPSALRDHFLGAFGLYAAVGGALGALMAALVAIEARLSGSRRDARVRTRCLVCFYGVVAVLARISTWIAKFSGVTVEGAPLRLIGA